jgi:hypothetical protein
VGGEQPPGNRREGQGSVDCEATERVQEGRHQDEVLHGDLVRSGFLIFHCAMIDVYE